METWSVHHLYQKAESSLGEDKAISLQKYANQLIKKNLPVIFTLGHLSEIIDINYSTLHETIERRRESANYKIFTIRKRSGGIRYIHAVSKELFLTQKFINSEILQKISPHPASYAFHPKGGIRACAQRHCHAKWLFQYDLKNFFFSINENSIYHIFKYAGYRPLLSFELARLCTTTILPKHLSKYLHNEKKSENNKHYNFYNKNLYLGVLPQGAPSSPMLSNLAAIQLDIDLTNFSDRFGFVYTRYADDITFSCSEKLPKDKSINYLHHEITRIFKKNGFEENKKKTKISRPGSKKIVLGLLVDKENPRLSKEAYKRIQRLLYATKKYGILAVARHENFYSPIGFLNHLQGLLAYVKDVDYKRWEEFYNLFKSFSNNRIPSN